MCIPIENYVRPTAGTRRDTSGEQRHVSLPYVAKPYFYRYNERVYIHEKRTETVQGPKMMVLCACLCVCVWIS